MRSSQARRSSSDPHRIGYGLPCAVVTVKPYLKANGGDAKFKKKWHNLAIFFWYIRANVQGSMKNTYIPAGASSVLTKAPRIVMAPVGGVSYNMHGMN